MHVPMFTAQLEKQKSIRHCPRCHTFPVHELTMRGGCRAATGIPRHRGPRGGAAGPACERHTGDRGRLKAPSGEARGSSEWRCPWQAQAMVSGPPAAPPSPPAGRGKSPRRAAAAGGPAAGGVAPARADLRRDRPPAGEQWSILIDSSMPPARTCRVSASLILPQPSVALPVLAWCC